MTLHIQDIDDKLIVEASNKYNIQLPKDFLMEHEEELKKDSKEPMAWDYFFEGYNYWSSEYSIKRSKNLNSFGKGEEVVEVANVLFYDDVKGASDFVHRAVSAGVKFGAFDLREIIALCDEKVSREAVFASSKLLKSEDLEDLYGEVSDELIIEIAKKEGLKLPTDIQEDLKYEAEERMYFEADVRNVIEMAEYSLNCLEMAKKSMDRSSGVSLFDMFTKGFASSYMKYASLEDSEYYIEEAQDALDNLNFALRDLMSDRNVRLKNVKLASAVDMWFDSGILDCLTHLQINKVQKNIKAAIKKVNTIKYELKNML